MKRKTGNNRYINFRFKKTRLKVMAILFLIPVAVVSGFTAYKNYVKNIDTSLNGSEIIESQQKNVPADVLAHISPTVAEMKKAGPVAEAIRVPILMYHYVEYVQDPKDTIRRSLDILPVTLDEQIKTLISAGYTFMTASELGEVFDGKRSLPEKPVLLTFDDGYRDFYTDAFPILKKYNAKATEYIISGFLNRPNHLLTSQVTEIIQSGLVEIGAHTIHHVWLKGLPLKTLTPEIFQSRVQLEQMFHVPIVSFAYPFGAFDSQAVSVVAAAGYKTAVSTVPGIEQDQANRYFLFRIRPGARTGKYLLDFLNQKTFKPW